MGRWLQSTLERRLFELESSQVGSCSVGSKTGGWVALSRSCRGWVGGFWSSSKILRGYQKAEPQILFAAACSRNVYHELSHCKFRKLTFVGLVHGSPSSWYRSSCDTSLTCRRKRRIPGALVTKALESPGASVPLLYQACHPLLSIPLFGLVIPSLPSLWTCYFALADRFKPASAASSGQTWIRGR